MACMPTVTIPDVELMCCGTWAASTGRVTVTPDDLDAMVAAYTDHLVDRPVIKIGHTDPRFAEPNHDGSPAFGWVENVRTCPDRTRLLGDFVGVPAELAAILPTAYRRRSVEMSWGVRTPAGKTYRAVLTGVALLGETAPAVKNLADIYALYSAGHVIAQSGWVLMSADTPTLPPHVPGAAEGEAMTSPAAPGGAMPYPSKILTALGLPATATDAEVAAAFAACKEGAAGPAMPPKMAAAADPPPAAEPPVPVPVPVAAAAAPVATPAAPVAPAQTVEQILAAAGVNLPPGIVLMSQSAVDAMQAQLELGVAARTQQDAERREQVLTSALSAGKVLPEHAADWRSALEANEAGTTALLGKIPAVIHVTQFGSALAPAATADTVTDEAVAAFMNSYGLGSFVPKGN